jgi:hypothetical protein
MQRSKLIRILNTIVNINLNSQQEENTFDITILYSNMKKISAFIIKLDTRSIEWNVNRHEHHLLASIFLLVQLLVVHVSLFFDAIEQANGV